MIKILVGRDIELFSKTELDNFWFEYGEIVNSSEISNCDEIDDVWNQSDYGTEKKRRKYNITLLTNDERRMMASRRWSNKLKHNFTYHQQKLSVSLNICHKENTKKLDYFLVDKKPEPWDDSEPSAVVSGKSLTMEIST